VALRALDLPALVVLRLRALPEMRLVAVAPIAVRSTRATGSVRCCVRDVAIVLDPALVAAIEAYLDAD